MATVDQAVVLGENLDEKITRFDIHQIIQHYLLMVTFTILVITGLPLTFHNQAISQWWVAAWGGIEVTRSVHHFAAWAMVIMCLYHLAYLSFNIFILRKPFPVKMIPTGQDFVMMYQELRYFVGLTKEKPKYDRFNWREKFEYWAIFWGMTIMAISGFIMMYPVLVTKFLPGWVIPTALIAHSYEAMMALIWIVLVHIFFNHFSPGVFPVNTSIFTGKVSRERYQREHSLEYNKLMGAPEAEPEVEEEKNSPVIEPPV